jgi:hypothetical protein
MPSLWLAALCAVAVLIRLAVMVIVPPGAGDASGSYCYRAVLVLDGQWDALWTMWHPPGFAVAIAAVSFLSAQVLTPWWTANAINLAATVGLIVAADRLIATRVRHPAARMACAALLACNRGFITWQDTPLTEPLFVLLCLLLFVVCDREQLSRRRLLAAGLLAGLASTLRFEGVTGL